MAKKKSQPNRWLFKEEPSHYGYDDLEKDGETVWDGVGNNLALQNLRAVRKGDRVLYYHTGKEKAIVGEMKVISDPYPESEDTPKAVVVKVKAVRRWPAPVTLATIKSIPELGDWDLVRMSRLSTVPVNGVQWSKVEELGRRG